MTGRPMQRGYGRLVLILLPAWLGSACELDDMVETEVTRAVASVGAASYVKASNTGAGDTFGWSVALSSDGSTLAVGAPYEDSAVTNVGGDQANNSAGSAGAVYVYTRSGTTWTQQAYIKASNTGAGDSFGWSVALSADGSTLAVGAPFEDSAATGINGDQTDNSAADAGAVYVFARSGTMWTQQAYVKATHTNAVDQFGWSIALSADGATLAVGAPGSEVTKPVVETIGDMSVVVDVDVTGAGAVYTFTRSGTAWSGHARLTACNTGWGNRFGYSVALSADGGILAAGAPFEGSAVIGTSCDQSDQSDVWAEESGAVYVFERDFAGVWTEPAYSKPTNIDAMDRFGWSVALSANGSTLAVSAPLEDSKQISLEDEDQTDNSAEDAGAVYVFERNASSSPAYIKASNTGAIDVFGESIALSADGSTLAVGAVGEDGAGTGLGGNQADNSAANSGAVYVFTRSGTAWSQPAYVKAVNTGAGDLFGESVALSADGAILAAGAYSEDSAATGVGGDQADNSAANSGAVYAYH